MAVCFPQCLKHTAGLLSYAFARHPSHECLDSMATEKPGLNCFGLIALASTCVFLAGAGAFGEIAGSLRATRWSQSVGSLDSSSARSLTMVKELSLWLGTGWTATPNRGLSANSNNTSFYIVVQIIIQVLVKMSDSLGNKDCLGQLIFRDPQQWDGRRLCII